jgi:alpha-2-macroglobulin
VKLIIWLQNNNSKGLTKFTEQFNNNPHPMKTVDYYLFQSLHLRILLKNPIIVVTAFLLIFTNCREKPAELHVDPAFTQYIASFTSGEISVESPIQVQLAEVPEGLDSGSPLPEGLFRFKPELQGETAMLSGGTVRFRPSAPMKPGTRYIAVFNLGKLIEVEKKLSDFSFSFTTITQNFSLEEDGLYVSPTLLTGLMSWSGKVVTADAADPAVIQQMVTASYDNKVIPVSWTNTPDRRSFIFLADSLLRHDTQEKTLTLKWDGKPLNVSEEGKMEIKIPARNQFKILSVKPLMTPEQQVVVTFSDPLMVGQPIEGIVELESNSNFTWQIDANKLIIWPAPAITGEQKVTFHRGLKSSSSASLTETEVFTVLFRNLKPGIKLLGKGVIVPDEGNLSFPFEAVSLKAVDLRIIKIYASNIRQFLQENSLDGNSDLKKVGRLVYGGKVDLLPDKPEKLHQWSTYRIDLNRYLTIEQGAIYRVELRMKKSYSLYDCGTATNEDVQEEEEEREENWEAPGWYSLSYWPRGFDWEQRENPCHVSYYTSERFVSRNIFASNLGIIAKEGKGFMFTFAVTSLTTAQPEEKADITIYDYQHQAMGKVTTDNKGMATLQLNGKPFVAVASKGNQTGYLRLDDGASLSLSNFNITGQEIQEGIKGFLYGERGVWRPGDRLFLTFILDDPEGKLPANTPVVFKLTNSRGQEVNRQVATSSENGFYHFPVTTQPDDLTGNWYAKVQIGGATFVQRLKIEAVKPNRLKIDLQLPETIFADGGQTASLSSEWLHGAKAPYLKALVEVELFPVKTVFKGFEKYSFDNPGATFTSSKQILYEGKLNEQGSASLPLKLQSPQAAPGKLRAWFTTRVFEEGGDFSINVQSTGYSPFKKYLGIRMPDSEDGWFKTGTDYQPELVAVDAQGKPAGIGKAEVSLYKIEWRWWWESGDDQLAQYVSGKHMQPVQKWSLNEQGSKTNLQLNVPYRDWRDNGRYLLYVRDTENGHSSGVTFYMSEWGSWRSGDSPDGAALLSLRTDKEKYAPGEKIKVKLPSPEKGRALVSLEDGRQVKDIFWIETVENETSFEIDVKPGMAPTLYIHVSLIQPYGNLTNDAPIRMYGVAGVSVEDPQTVLKPVIKVRDELEPEKEFTVEVMEQRGSPMTYTLAIVDEGLLDLTNFRTPDPHSHFYAREALGVKTYDLFDYVAGAYGARLEKAFAVGGDADKVENGKKQANRFEPVVIFAGPFTIAKGKSRSHTFRMPNYVGSVRVMVVAGSKSAFGNSSKDVKVRKAVMMLATLPRVAAPGEELSVPVSVFSMTESAREVTIEAETNTLFNIEGSKTRTIAFTQPGDKLAFFKLKTTDKTGVATVKLTAQSGSETATYQVEMEVRNPNPPIVTAESRLLEPGELWNAELQIPAMSEGKEAYIELGSLPGLNLSQHLGQLIEYPHGCTEQTVSGAFAQLYLDNLVVLSVQEKARMEENIHAAIQRLRTMQTASGGFAYWPGQNAADEWSTSYAGHFMVLAAQKGYKVPEEMKNRWIAWQRQRAREWRPAAGAEPFIQQQETLIQAYRLYSLALAGAPEQGVMNRFREEVGNHSAARWRLAAAYLITGQPAAANQLLQSHQPGAEDYPHHGPTFGSALRDKAMILETLTLQNDRKSAFPLLMEMAREIGNSSWLSTQTAAWSFYSIAKFYGSRSVEEGIDANVASDGKTVRHRSEVPLIRLPASVSPQDKLIATIENNGKAPLFVQLAARGIPLEEVKEASENNLRMTSWFSDRNGTRIDPAIQNQGSDMVLNISVTHPGIRGAYKQLALTTIFPSGWEIMNRRISDMPDASPAGYDYQDIRDDRVYTYFGLNPGETRSFRFALNATYEGRFLMPAIVCEAMYDNTVFASQPGGWVTVIR